MSQDEPAGDGTRPVDEIQPVANYWVRPAKRSEMSPLSPLETDVIAFHTRIPGYKRTPLHALQSIANRLQVGSIWMKYEGDRFGLPSFKALGAIWGLYRLLDRRTAGGLDGKWESVDELRRLVATPGLTVVSATDGNHGRAVAHAAALFGFASHILVPAGTAISRIEGIAAEGARVEIVDGDYDLAVASAAKKADDNHVVVSDTSWDGYEEVPGWIAEGYQTLFTEFHTQVLESGAPFPDLLLVPVGVGTLAQAAIDYCRRASASTLVVAVEPIDAACVLRSLQADALVTVPGPHHSIMAGLNCGTPSLVAWPTLRNGLRAAIAIDDQQTVTALRMLADVGIEAGETGAASLAGLIAITSGEFGGLSKELNLTKQTAVGLICTEGITDPVNYTRLVKSPHL